MSPDSENAKLDVPLVHSQAQYCHIDSLSMILRRLGDAYEAWYMGPVSGQFFGLHYLPKPNFIWLSFGNYPLKCLLTFLEEHGYSYQYDEGKNWNEAFATLKNYLKNDKPVLVISHMGWLSYNREYEVFKQVGGVIDHYVVATGYRNDEIVYVNDPHPDLHKKDAELPTADFRIGWEEKLEEIQSLRCPMLVVTARKTKPDAKTILIKALNRAVHNLNTKSGDHGIAGFRKACEEIPELMRKNDSSVQNTLGEWAFFTFRVSEQNRKDTAKFLKHAATKLNLEKLREAADSIVEASVCYGNLRQIFKESLESGIQPSRIADNVEPLLSRACEKERLCVELMDAAIS
jgi:hypothetical protein